MPIISENKYDVIIIGGGVAGLAAAFQLAESEKSVLLVEALEHFGGRTAGGDGWDTGRHLATSAYHSFNHLLDQIGSLNNLHLRPLAIHSKRSGRTKTWNLSLPRIGTISAPISLIFDDYFPISDRFKILVKLSKLKSINPDDEINRSVLGKISFAEYMKINSWPATLVEGFGNPVSRGMMNLPPNKANALPVIKAIKLLLSENHLNAGWSSPNHHGSLLSDDVPSALVAAGIDFKTEQRVNQIAKIHDRWTIQLNEGVYSARALILAVPPDQYSKIEMTSQQQSLKVQADSVEFRGIATVRARVDGLEALNGPIAINDKDDSLWFLSAAEEGKILIEQVVSGIHKSDGVNRQSLLERFKRELLDNFDIEVESQMVEIRNYPKATPSFYPDVKRPDQNLSDNLFIAGDWVETGLPATLEAAALSGVRAAQAII